MKKDKDKPIFNSECDHDSEKEWVFNGECNHDKEPDTDMYYGK